MVRAPALHGNGARTRARACAVLGVEVLAHCRVRFRDRLRVSLRVSFRVRFGSLSRRLLRVIGAGLARQALTATLPGPSPAADCALAGVSEIRDSRCHRTAGSS